VFEVGRFKVWVDEAALVDADDIFAAVEAPES